MKFGLFYEHQLPRPWHEDSEYQLFQDSLEQCELADKLGIEYAWEVEHHFLEEYAHSSAPEVFLGAASQRTKNMRLGHGVVDMPSSFNHPIRVAERIATLDLLSNGRVDFGTGEAGSEAELSGFGVDVNRKRDMWEESLRVALRAMTEVPFTGHTGEFVTVPPRNVIPKPRQKPHPPVWVACSVAPTIQLAAQKGIGALSFAFAEPEEARGWVTDYMATFEREGVPIGDAVNPQIAVVTTFMCAPTTQQALAQSLEGSNFFGYCSGHYYALGKHHPGKTDVWGSFLRDRAATGYSPEEVIADAANDGEKAKAARAGATGTPDQVRDYVRRFEEAGVDQLIFIQQAGNTRHEHVMESLELFGKEVLPEFKERDEKAVAKKEKRLAPVIDKVMSRKPAEDHPPLADPDYSFSALPRQYAEQTGDEATLAFLEKAANSLASGRPFMEAAQDVPDDMRIS
jgi:alkanesulfonate monooxygenase SsuD/methylene tetrahydromethanopterin reductase-like flavin-dependent oxidoreductase (luciferase family)